MTLPSIGDVVDDKYRIERKLGEGGTSTIFEAHHVFTAKKFAIKWLAPELAKNDLAVQLLLHEAKVSGHFVHPNAAQVYDICRTEDSYYLLMEFLEGESLEVRLAREKRLSVAAACDALLPCMDALHAAHRVGIVHRDLKPSNIFLSRIEGHPTDIPKVLDFGIANYLAGGVDVSPHTAGSGTPLYMAPEQMWAQPADPRFDIYAFGVVLYELVSGQPPFDSDDFDDLVHRITESAPARLDELAGVDSGFADVVARAMARGSEDRFATMADFAAAVRPYSSQGRAVMNALATQPPRTDTQEERRSDAPVARRPWANTTIGVGTPQEEPLANAGAPETPELRATSAIASTEPSIVVDLKSALAESSPGEVNAASDDAPLMAANKPLPSPPPIVLPPPRVASAAPTSVAPPALPSLPLPAASQESSAPDVDVVAAREDTFASGEATWTTDDLLVEQMRTRRPPRIGLMATLGGALLLTVYALARDPEAPAPPAPAPIRQAAIEPVAPAPTPPIAAAAAVPDPFAEIVKPMEPAASPAADSPPTYADARAERIARREARSAARRAAIEARYAAKRAAIEARAQSRAAIEPRALPLKPLHDANDERVKDDRAKDDGPKVYASKSIASGKRTAELESDGRRERSASTAARDPFALPNADLSRKDF